MGKLALRSALAITALVTFVLTSLFWIAAYSIAIDDGPAAPASAEDRPPAVVPAKAPARAGDIVVAPSGLVIPVTGVRSDQLIDTFTQSRAGGSRVHDAIDIMAPAGTPVIAAAEGTVEKLFFSPGGGGITVYVRSPDRRWIYYYAHLQGYAPGLREGQQVRKGDRLGSVGSTGNASPAGPHLHFAIHRMAADDDWHGGSAINPYPLLAGRGTGG